MSQGIIHSTVYPVRMFIGNPAYRILLFLKARYGFAKRYTETVLRCYGYTLRVPDIASFIYQFKDIFVEEYYHFSSNSLSPVIIDCGANIGTSCLYYKSIFPDATVTAFEADPSIAVILKENLEKNSVTGVTVINKAVWIHDKGVEFASDGADGGSIHGLAEKVSVPSVRLRDFIIVTGHVDFLKVDIEGAEVDVIADCADSLKNVDSVYVEYHAWKGQEQRLDILLSTLTESGFTYYIQSMNDVPSPLRKTGTIPATDMQLHVFAIRKNTQR